MSINDYILYTNLINPLLVVHRIVGNTVAIALAARNFLFALTGLELIFVCFGSAIFWFSVPGEYHFEYTFRFLQCPSNIPDVCRFHQTALQTFDAYAGHPLITTPTIDVHIQHLILLLCRLSDSRTVFIPDECELGITELNFLVHQVTQKDIKLKIIKWAPLHIMSCCPQSRRLKHFGASISHATEHLLPPTDRICSNPHEPALINGTRLTFLGITSPLARVTLLTHPNQSATPGPLVDSSGCSVGAVLLELASEIRGYLGFSFQTLVLHNRDTAGKCWQLSFWLGFVRLSAAIYPFSIICEYPIRDKKCRKKHSKG